MEGKLIHSIQKAFSILDILVFEDTERKGMGLFRIAEKINQKPNTVHNILKTMVACGYVSRNEKSLYVAGTKCYDIVNIGRLTNNDILTQQLKALLCELGDRINEPVILAALINGNRIPVVAVDDKNMIKVDISAEEMAHIYERPTGRILVSFADDVSLQMIKSKWGYPGKKWDNAADEKAFDAKRSEVRKQGYVIKTEYEDTIVSIAVPVADTGGKVKYSLGSYAPLFRCDKSKQKTILAQLQKTAEIIGKMI